MRVTLTKCCKYNWLLLGYSPATELPLHVTVSYTDCILTNTKTKLRLRHEEMLAKCQQPVMNSSPMVLPIISHLMGKVFEDLHRHKPQVLSLAGMFTLTR